MALLGLALGCGGLPPASGGAVHKWIDSDGVTHYSDEPPESVETTLIQLPEPTLVEAASDNDRLADDYYSISNQWQRMHQERLERERLNLEREKIRAARQTQAPAPAPQIEDDDDVRYVPIYSRFGFYRPHRRHHHRHPGDGRPQHRPTKPSGLGTFPTQ